MKRREFITLLGGAAAWPLAARAQQGERIRRIGVLMTLAADSPDAQANFAAFLQGLQQLGWTDDRNVRIDYRWGAGDADNIAGSKLLCFAAFPLPRGAPPRARPIATPTGGRSCASSRRHKPVACRSHAARANATEANEPT